jgi:hypothetical protein
MRTITEKQLRQVIARDPQATIITLQARKEPKMRKRDNPFLGKVTKCTTVQGVVNFNYAAIVSQLINRGYKPNPLPWGQHDPKVPGVIHHDGKMYLQVMIQKRNVKYLADDCREIEIDILTPFLSDKDDITIGNYRFETIDYVEIKGERYAIKHQVKGK